MTDKLITRSAFAHDTYTPDNMEGVEGCHVCGGAEGSLPTCCPGRQMTAEESEAVYAGQLDFDRATMVWRPIWWRAIGEDAVTVGSITVTR